jgi:hypothetical protein
MSGSDTMKGWFIGRIPDDWFTGAPEITADRDEILVIGSVAAPELEADGSDEVRREALRSRIQAFRERTRNHRIEIARAAESAFDRKVSWGARCGDEEAIFTHLAAPAMTRLRMSERTVLDTLVDAGVARSRSDALAWCVRLVGAHTADWLTDLRSALEKVEEVRDRGPVQE